MVTNHFTRALPWWLIGTIPFLLGASFGLFFVPRQPNPLQESHNPCNVLTPWDGFWYEKISRDGYTYDPQAPSSTAFFPGYPLAAWCIAKTTGASTAASLLIVSQISLLCCYMVLDLYVVERGKTFSQHPDFQDMVFAVFCLFPTSYTWHFAYSESLFLLVALCAFSLMSRRANVLIVAATIGIATAIRPTGVALFAPLWIYIWETAPSWRKAFSRMLLTAPIAMWGLLAYMGYQWVSLGTPLAFVQTQGLWARRMPHDAVDKLFALASLEPLWSIYVPGYRAYWGNQEISFVPAFYSMYFSNVLYFIFAAVLLLVGYRKRWLDSKEVSVGVSLLVLTYCLNGHEQMMQSQARYASVVFPAHFVLAALISRSPFKLRLLLAAVAVSFLFAYSALMVAWFRVC